MAPPSPRTTVGLSRPIYSILLSFPVVCFTLTLFTDIAYWRTSVLMWQHFSEWLLFAGLVFAALAVVVGIIEMLVRPYLRDVGPTWVQLIGGAVVVVLALWNSLVHASDGWTGVMPYGLVISLVTVILMIAIALVGRTAIVRHHDGVTGHV